MSAIIIIFWVVLCFVCGLVASNCGRSFAAYFVLSLLLSPLIGFIVLLIKGKITKDEVLDNTSHIFYCPKCSSVYSGTSEGSTSCPDCKIPMNETTVIADQWHSFDSQKKAEMKKMFAEGKYMRNGTILGSQIEHFSSSDNNADQIKKYKELLDMGAITQEEYDGKKKQLLGL